MKHLTHILVALAVGVVTLISPQMIGAGSPLPTEHKAQGKQCVPTITKVEFRSDLTRVYVTLSGRPHTSYRIDYVRMILPSGKGLSFTDIDGIDAKRYFQWESDGKIDLEIDFPAVKSVGSFTLEFLGLDGEKLIASYGRSGMRNTSSKSKKK